jgi:predicted DNA-binding protein (MmcQ/YjbR family)
MSESRAGGRSKRAPAGATKSPAVTKTAKKKKTAAAAPKRVAPKAKTAPASHGEDATFQKVRALCLALPDTKLTMTWGSPHFRVGEKIFCGFGKHREKWVLGVKLAQSHARSVIKEARFWPAPYVGKHGWVSMDVTQRKSWDEVAALVRESYELIAPKASRAKLR